MPSTALIHIDKLTPDNGAIQDLRELLFLSTLQADAIEKTLTLHTGAIHKHKIGGIGQMGLVGETMPACRPTFNATHIDTQEKEWNLGEFTIAEEICFKDLLPTLARHALKTKTAAADLTGTDYLNLIVEPRLQQAIDNMLWRLLWFGDQNAKNNAQGGIISDNIDPKYLQVTDGLFKHLFAITAAKPALRTTIAANTKTTYQDQRQAMRLPGAATTVIDDLIYNANMKLRQAPDRIILCTQSFADALAQDAKRNTGSDLQWKALFDGMASTTHYNGQQIIALPRWDTLIHTLENNNTALNKPHRALYVSQSTLWAGIASENMLAELDVWFSKDDQVNRIIARDQIGTLVWDEDLLQFAY